MKHQIALILAGAAFATQLATIDAEKNDGVTTPALAAQNVFEFEKVNPPDFPAVRIIGLGTEYDEDSNSAKCAAHQVAVDFVQVGDDEATITKQIERFVRAARDLTWESHFDGATNAGPVLVVREDYGALAPKDATAFYKGGGLVLTVNTVVD